ADAQNATALASGDDACCDAVSNLALVGGNIEPAQGYRGDTAGGIGNVAQCLRRTGLVWLVLRQARLPLRTGAVADPEARTVEFERIARKLEQGLLEAIAVSPSSYTSGSHVTYFQGRDARGPIGRSERILRPASLDVDYLMASSAIPFLFPAIPLTIGGAHESFGDGSMRQTAPISPAVHLGASRIMVIGSAATDQAAVRAATEGEQFSYPS